jgi:hypothetical protein
MLRSLKRFLPLFGNQSARMNRKKLALQIETLEHRWMPSATTIGGTVYHDATDTGILVAGEQGIASDTIQLENSLGQVIAQTTTDANGQYVFTQDNTINTQPTTQVQKATFGPQTTNYSGKQSVPQFDPSLGTLTGVDVIVDASLTSDIKVQSLDNAPSHVTGNVSGQVSLTVGNGIQPLVTSLANDEGIDLPAYDNANPFAGAASHDFGNGTATNSNSITLTSANADLSQFTGTGQVALNESAIATSSATGAGNLLSEINSTAQGQIEVVYHYTPSNSLQPGQYTVVEPQTPAGYLDGKNTADNVNVLPPVPKNTIPVTLDAQNSSLNNNYGKLLPLSLSGYVYVDNPNTGIRVPPTAGIPGSQGIGGVTINLTGTDDLGNPVSASTVTAADGSYSFNNLRPGTYAINEPQQPAGYLDGKSTIGSQGGLTGEDRFYNINLIQQNGINNNFGKLQPAQIGGFVYNDGNSDGVRDPGDFGIGSVTVYLSGMNDQGTQINRAVQTNADGSFNFVALYPGNYTLSDQPPAGYNAGALNLGNLGGTKDPSHMFVTLGGNAVGTDYDFGYTQPQSPTQPSNPPSNPTTPPTAIQALQSTTSSPLTKREFTGNDWLSWASL